jgi:MoaA/NifB/PqqE/SkfB family radical SAM enzyme
MAQMDFLIGVARDLDLKILLQPFDNALIEEKPFERKLAQDTLGGLFRSVLDRAPDLIANTPDYIDFVMQGRWLTPDMCLAGRRTCFINSNGDVFPCLPLLLNNGPTLNGLTAGWAEAFQGVSLEGCRPCRFPCMAELYNTFSCKPRTWLHMAKMTR